MALNITAVPQDVTDEQTEVAARSHDRSDEQKTMDGWVKELITEWEAAGKPDQAHAPYRRYSIPKDEKTDLKKLIRRACVLGKVDPLYWKDSKPNSEGRVFVKFTVGPPKPKAEGNGQTAPATDATPGAPQGTGDEGGDQPQAQPDQGRRFGRR